VATAVVPTNPVATPVATPAVAPADVGVLVPAAAVAATPELVAASVVAAARAHTELSVAVPPSPGLGTEMARRSRSLSPARDMVPHPSVPLPADAVALLPAPSPSSASSGPEFPPPDGPFDLRPPRRILRRRTVHPSPTGSPDYEPPGRRARSEGRLGGTDR
jgi:hypothetical protein